MGIEKISMDAAQSRLLDQVGTAMLAKGLKSAEDEAAGLMKLIQTAAPLPEGSGQRVDLFA